MCVCVIRVLDIWVHNIHLMPFVCGWKPNTHKATWGPFWKQLESILLIVNLWARFIKTTEQFAQIYGVLMSPVITKHVSPYINRVHSVRHGDTATVLERLADEAFVLQLQFSMKLYMLDRFSSIVVARPKTTSWLLVCSTTGCNRFCAWGILRFWSCCAWRLSAPPQPPLVCVTVMDLWLTIQAFNNCNLLHQRQRLLLIFYNIPSNRILVCPFHRFWLHHL